jgi:pimeloyl-ACP methyl ester carboxylesterase
MRFILVHGGMHGGWCWEKLVPELENLGHQAVAPDLPGHGTRRQETATLEGYRDAVLERLEPGDILVGHSMGGSVITLAADAAAERIRHLIYLAAPIPQPSEGKTISDCIPQFSGRTKSFLKSNDQEFWCPNLQSATDLFYHDCSVEARQWAFERIQPQSFLPMTTVLRLINFWSSATPRSYIACLDDKTSISITVQENLKRLGLRVAYPIWASHSPFLSRPKELAKLLADIAEQPVGADPDMALIRSVT